MKEIPKYKQTNYCLDCGVKITPYGKRCYSCNNKLQHKLNPSLKTICIGNLPRNNFGKNNPAYRDGRTLKKYYCIDCNVEVSDYRIKRCNKCKYKQLSYRFILEGNPNWKDGKSFEPYPLGWNKTFKEQIRYRDKYKCQLCGVPETECYRKLDVHHIDYDKNNLTPNNLVSLCSSCHMKTNFNRSFWEELFREKKIKYE